MCVLLVLAVLSACSADENPVSDNDRVAVNFSAGIQTRAANNSWEEGDAIGITMFQAGSETVAEGTYVNCKYLTAAGNIGNFKPASDKETIYFPKDGSKVDFMAYYPYNEEMKADYKIPLVVASQTSLGKLDFMTSEHLEGSSKDSPNVKLRFYHRLSKLIFRLKMENNEQADWLKGARITIKGMLVRGTYNLLAGELTTDLSSVEEITIPTDSQTGSKAEGIVLPRPGKAGVTFTITLTNGARYSAVMDPELNLDAGYKYTFNITLKKTPMTVTADIQDWNDGGELNEQAQVIEIATGNTDDYFQTGDVLGLFVTTGQTANQSLGNYTFDKENQTWSSQTLNFWEDIDGTGKLSFNAIKTVTKAPEGSHQIDDVLLAYTDPMDRYTSVMLPFAHAGSLLIVKLKSPEGGYTQSELETATVVLPGFLTGATFDYARYTAGTEKANIVLTKQAGEPTWKGCIQPQTIPVNTTYIKVTIKGVDYLVSTKTDAIQEFQANKRLTIIITLNKKELGSISATITDWGLLPDIQVDTDIDQ